MGTVFISLEAEIARLSGELAAARAANKRLANGNHRLTLDVRRLAESNVQLATELEATLAKLGDAVRAVREPEYGGEGTA